MIKNKTIVSLLAALIFTAAFFTPMTAYALGLDEPIQTEAISETDETDIDVSNLDDVDIESLDYEELRGRGFYGSTDSLRLIFDNRRCCYCYYYNHWLVYWKHHFC